ncbi:MAG: hypothetical protein RLZZ165_2461 [Bacteroidota bacterium]|jgi:hypothetical protein
METEDICKAADWLQKNWELLPPSDLDWASLRAALKARLEWMLQNEFERLVQAMYRLDVAESKFRMALAMPTVGERAARLSEIILERELQRLATWRRYSGGFPGCI